MYPLLDQEVAIYQPTLNRVMYYNPSRDVMGGTRLPEPGPASSHSTQNPSTPVLRAENLPSNFSTPAWLENYKIGRTSRRRAVVDYVLQRIYNCIIKMRKGHPVPLAQRVTGYYIWKVFEKHEAIWGWVESNGYHVTWTSEQILGFQKLLAVLKEVSCLCTKRNDKGSNSVSQPGADMVHRGLVRLGIENLAVVSNGRFEYRFFPKGYSQPLHQRDRFSECEQAHIDEFLPGYWGPAIKENLETLLRVSSQYDEPTPRASIEGHPGSTSSEEELDDRMWRAREHVLRAIALMDFGIHGASDQHLPALLDMHESLLDAVVNPILEFVDRTVQRRERFEKKRRRFEARFLR